MFLGLANINFNWSHVPISLWLGGQKRRLVGLRYVPSSPRKLRGYCGILAVR